MNAIDRLIEHERIRYESRRMMNEDFLDDMSPREEERLLPEETSKDFPYSFSI